MKPSQIMHQMKVWFSVAVESVLFKLIHKFNSTTLRPFKCRFSGHTSFFCSASATAKYIALPVAFMQSQRKKPPMLTINTTGLTIEYYVLKLMGNWRWLPWRKFQFCWWCLQQQALLGQRSMIFAKSKKSTQTMSQHRLRPSTRIALVLDLWSMVKI